MKYDAEHWMQNPKNFEKAQKSGLFIKYYKEMTYQGTYELDFLEYVDSLNILDKVSKLSSISYVLNGNRTYFPDFFIEDLNLIVEIKSDFYYKLHYEKNLAKQIECLIRGYNFIFIINKNYTEFNEIIKNLINNK